jgi:hypothetical protein
VKPDAQVCGPLAAQSNTRVQEVDSELRALEEGVAHRFSDFAGLSEVVSRAGAGVYTIWDDAGGLVYVGIVGREIPWEQDSPAACAATPPAAAAAISSASKLPTTTSCHSSRASK